MAVRRCEMLIVFSLALFCGQLFAQNNADHADWSDLPVGWKTRCAPRGCLIHAEVLRGDSGSPPNPKDFREYIGVDVALARKTRQPGYIAFEVDPRATSNRAIFIAFVKTMKAGNSWKASLDEDGTMEIPIARCDQWSCQAHIPGGGFDVEPSTGKRIDLLEKFLTSDAVMAVDLAPAQVPHAP